MKCNDNMCIYASSYTTSYSGTHVVSIIVLKYYFGWHCLADWFCIYSKAVSIISLSSGKLNWFSVNSHLFIKNDSMLPGPSWPINHDT